MSPDSRLPHHQIVNLLRAAGEPTRLRLLALLAESDLTVSDLIEILGQSQPRISRHLKLLSEAGILERYQEGAWVCYRLADQGPMAPLVELIIGHCNPDDPNAAKDRERLETLKRKRAKGAAEYFSRNAASWDTIRSLHVDEQRVEAEMLKLVGEEKFRSMLDLGTGTGRILELFSPYYEKGTGIDASRDMLAVARARLDQAGLSRVQSRQGDLFTLPTRPEDHDLVTIHQVLHYLEDPAAAIREARTALKPGGRLLIVDFAPHTLEFLRDEHAHHRLGFSDEIMRGWLEDAGLEVTDFVELEPEAGGGKGEQERLTVCLWLARDPR